MFSLLLEFSDSVSAFITGFDSLPHPVVCLFVMNPDPPPAPEAVVYPSISPPPSPHFLCIRYTDYVLHQLISWMDSLDNAAVLIYISDHGESFWDDERKLSLHGSYELNEAEYHVPCFIWYSNEFLQQQPQKIHTLEDNKHIPQNSSTIFHTLLHLADIVEIVDSTKSLCSTYVQPLDSFQVLSGDGEIKTYIIQ